MKTFPAGKDKKCRVRTLCHRENPAQPGRPRQPHPGIAFLRPDQNAKVKLTAYDYAIYAGLDAKLERISADTIANEEGESFYLIRVRTECDYLGSRDGSLKIIPGMTAMVDILTGE